MKLAKKEKGSFCNNMPRLQFRYNFIARHLSSFENKLEKKRVQLALLQPKTKLNFKETSLKNMSANDNGCRKLVFCKERGY